MSSQPIAALTAPAPSRRLSHVAAYAAPSPCAPEEIRLNANVGPSWTNDDRLSRFNEYPNDGDVIESIATTFDVSGSQVAIGAGADEILDRVCRAFLDAGQTAVVHAPSFEMVPRYVQLAGATVATVDWCEAAFPLQAFGDAVQDENAAVAFLTSPNNPTGGVIPLADIEALAARCPSTLIVADFAYVDFAGEDPTQALLAFSNVIVVRTFSKAWGLAGLRVGYALGPADVIGSLRRAGSPFPVSQPSLDAVCEVLRQPLARQSAVRRVKEERSLLYEALQRAGLRPLPSQGNFVFCRADSDAVRTAQWWSAALAALGLRVRTFGTPGLEDALRITCPGRAAAFDRLLNAIEVISAPEAILFDLDGVIADVSQSYRRCIQKTAFAFGVSLSTADIDAAKAAGEANDDWALTLRLIRIRRPSMSVTLDGVKEVFERLYNGSQSVEGLSQRERLLVSRADLAALAERMPLAIVTGRPRRDAEEFLERFGLRPLFSSVVTREDARLKPDPAPVRTALSQLGVQRAWMLGDTPDDVRAARGAGVLPLGILPSSESASPLSGALQKAGAADVWRAQEALAQLQAVLP